jgi:hypothetical protein
MEQELPRQQGSHLTQGTLRELREEEETSPQMSEEPHSPRLLSRITHPRDLQGLPLRQTKGSIKTYYSSAMPSSRDTARGRNPKGPYIPTSNPCSSKLLGRIESDAMQLLSHSLPPSRVTTRNLKWQREGLLPTKRDSAPPALLFRMQMGRSRTPSPSDESEFAWMRGKRGKAVPLSENLAKTLKLLDVYTVDPKAAKRSLVNQPDCPEFPDSEWNNVITGKAVSLDAVLTGQLSTTNDDLKTERFGDIKVTFGAVEPTKTVKSGGDWSIAWNRTVRAVTFAFPHRHSELTSYGEFIINLFAVTHPTVHNRVIAFDKAVRRRAGSVRNLELSAFEKYADLKIAHMDSIGVAVSAGASSSTGDKGKGDKHSKGWKKDEPCNKWNEGRCDKKEEECRRKHVCNNCSKPGHKGKECRKPGGA